MNKMNKKERRRKIYKRVILFSFIVYLVCLLILNWFVFHFKFSYRSFILIISLLGFPYGRKFLDSKIAPEKYTRRQLYSLYLGHFIIFLIILYWGICFFLPQMRKQTMLGGLILQFLLLFYLFYFIGALTIVLKNNSDEHP